MVSFHVLSLLTRTSISHVVTGGTIALTGQPSFCPLCKQEKPVDLSADGQWKTKVLL